MSPQILDSIARDLDRTIRRVDLAMARCQGLANAQEARVLSMAGPALPQPPLPRRNRPPED